MKQLSKFILFYFIIGNILFSCVNKKNEEPNPDSGTSKGNLRLHLHTYIDINEVDAYNIVYTSSTGRKISLSLAQLYLSNFQLVKMDGSLYNVPDAMILQEQGVDSYNIADVPAGNYKSVRFHVGLDSSTNKKIPENTTTDLLNKPIMWFGSTAQPDGYIYMNLQGKIDTSAAANGIEADMQTFSYKIGTQVHYKLVVMPDRNFTVTPDQTEYLHMYTDYSKLFNGIQLNSNSNLVISSPSEITGALATKISNNIPSMFVYE